MAATSLPTPIEPKPAPDPAAAKLLLAWQMKLLPFMTRFLAGMAVVFFLLTVLAAYEMRRFLTIDERGNARVAVASMLDEQRKAHPASLAGDVIQQSLLVLEADAIDKRYRQANALLMSRIWTRQLAFVTGMVLAFTGAVFILGKFSESPTDASGGSDALKASISSSSPGLILAFFGTAILLVSLVVQPQITVQDQPVYFVTMGLAPAPAPGGASTAGPEDPFPTPASEDAE